MLFASVDQCQLPSVIQQHLTHVVLCSWMSLINAQKCFDFKYWPWITEEMKWAQTPDMHERVQTCSMQLHPCSVQFIWDPNSTLIIFCETS
jgi:hypothetical protein